MKTKNTILLEQVKIGRNRGNIATPNIYITANFSGLVQALKSGGIKLVLLAHNLEHHA